MKKLIIIALLFCGTAAMAQDKPVSVSEKPNSVYAAQDTFYVEKVLVKNQLIYAKTGKVTRRWWTKTKVKSGYIVKQADGWFLINGKLMQPDRFAYSYNDTIVKK